MTLRIELERLFEGIRRDTGKPERHLTVSELEPENAAAGIQRHALLGHLQRQREFSIIVVNPRCQPVDKRVA